MVGVVSWLVVTEIARERTSVDSCWVEGATSRDEMAGVGGGGKGVAVPRAAVVVSGCVTVVCSETVGTTVTRVARLTGTRVARLLTEAGGKKTTELAANRELDGSTLGIGTSVTVMATALLVSGRMLETVTAVPGWSNEVNGVGAVELNRGRRAEPAVATDVCSVVVGTAVASPSTEVVPAEDRGGRSEAVVVGRSNISLVLVKKSSELEGIREETEGSTTAGPRLVAAGDSLAAELGTSRLCPTDVAELRAACPLLVVGSSGAEVSLGKEGSVAGEGCRVSEVIWREGDGEGCRVTEET